MEEYICLNCRKVFRAGSNYAKCCGEIEIFSTQKHGELLTGSSNSWISVWERWKNNPIFLEVSSELSENGSYGAATAINAFIEELFEYYKKNNE